MMYLIIMAAAAKKLINLNEINTKEYINYLKHGTYL
jgi:hypothetical protein